MFSPSKGWDIAAHKLRKSLESKDGKDIARTTRKLCLCTLQLIALCLGCLLKGKQDYGSIAQVEGNRTAVAW